MILYAVVFIPKNFALSFPAHPYEILPVRTKLLIGSLSFIRRVKETVCARISIEKLT